MPFIRSVLPNGLTVILARETSAPVVQVTVGYRVGIADEPPAHTGYTRLFQGLMFTPTVHRTGEWNSILDTYGGTNIEGNLNFDYEWYSTQVPNGALDRLLWMEADRMGYLRDALSQQTFDLTRREFLNPYKPTAERDEKEYFQRVAAKAYPIDHPYSRWMGARDHVAQATLADAHAWLERYHGAANAVLVVVGDIDLAKTTESVSHYFSTLPSGPALSHRLEWPVTIDGIQRVQLHEQIKTPMLTKIWSVPNEAHPDSPLLRVVSDVLEHSRLVPRLFRTGIARGVQVEIREHKLNSLLMINVPYGEAAQSTTVENALDEEVTRLVKDGPTHEELRRVGSEHYAALVRTLEDVSRRADLLLEGEIVSGQPDLLIRQYETIREATPDAVRAAAQRWMSPRNGVLVLDTQVAVGADPPAAVTPASRATSTGGLDKTSTAAISHSEALRSSTPEGSSQDPTTDIDRHQPPPVFATPAPRLPQPEHFKLSNGLAVVLIERHFAPLLQIEWKQSTGYAADMLSGPGMTFYTLEMMRQGTDHRTALEVNELQAELGAYAKAQVDPDHAALVFNGLARDPDRLIELISDELQHPAFRQSDLDVVKRAMPTFIRQKASRPNAARYVAYQVSYGMDHPYMLSLGGYGSLEALNNLTTQRLRDYHKKWVRPDNGTLIVVGDITRQQLSSLLERYLKDWRAPVDPVPQISLPPTPPRRPGRILLLNDPNATQSFVCGALLSEPLARQDIGTAGLFADLLGRSSNARLSQVPAQYRAYRTESSLDVLKGGTILTVESQAPTESTVALMKWLFHEMLDIRGARVPDAKEVMRIQEGRANAFLGVSASSVDLLVSYDQTIGSGRDDASWVNMVEETRAITLPQVRTIAPTLVDPRAMTWVVIGDARKLEAPFRGLGIGEVEVHD